MKASELRIGNIVDNYREVFAKGWRWTNISHEDIYSIACGNDKNYRPIPLTEEILLKCGFELKTWIDDSVVEAIKSRIIKGEIRDFQLVVRNGKFWHDRLYGYGYSYKLLEHLHQLQNLYFALTGEELKIEL